MPSESKQLSAVSLHASAHSEPPVQGSPACTEQLPPEQVSLPLQNRPSLHDAALFVCAQVPDPLHASVVHWFPSDVHGVAASVRQKHWGCAGPLVIDARVKPHHAPPLVEDPAVSRRVDALAAPGGPLHGLF